LFGEQTFSHIFYSRTLIITGNTQWKKGQNLGSCQTALLNWHQRIYVAVFKLEDLA